MADAKTLEEIASPEYWDARYAKRAEEESFEWFKSFSHIEPFLRAHIPGPEDGGRTPRLLHLGCGNSSLPIDLHKTGYHSQICLDFSAVVIADMSSRYASLPGLEFQLGDVRHMTSLTSSSIDVAIDKGTLDAMLHGSLWDPPDDVRENTKAYIDEVLRVLKSGGVFVYITYRQPHFMKPMLEREGGWTLEVVELEGEKGAFGYFGFVMRKL